MLRLHFMVDRMDGFRTTFDGKGKSFGLEFFLERRNETSDIGFAFCFFGIQRVRDIFIGVVVEEFERQVLHLGFDLV